MGHYPEIAFATLKRYFKFLYIVRFSAKGPKRFQHLRACPVRACSALLALAPML